jgi:hypothetical protein
MVAGDSNELNSADVGAQQAQEATQAGLARLRRTHIRR